MPISGIIPNTHVSCSKTGWFYRGNKVSGLTRSVSRYRYNFIILKKTNLIKPFFHCVYIVFFHTKHNYLFCLKTQILFQFFLIIGYLLKTGFVAGYMIFLSDLLKLECCNRFSNKYCKAIPAIIVHHSTFVFTIEIRKPDIRTGLLNPNKRACLSNYKHT